MPDPEPEKTNPPPETLDLSGETTEALAAWKAFFAMLLDTRRPDGWESAISMKGETNRMPVVEVDAQKFHVEVQLRRPHLRDSSPLWAIAESCAGIFFKLALVRDWETFRRNALAEKRLSRARQDAETQGFTFEYIEKLISRLEVELAAGKAAAREEPGPERKIDPLPGASKEERISRALTLLFQNRDMSMREIAEKVGLSTHSTLSRDPKFAAAWEAACGPAPPRGHKETGDKETRGRLEAYDPEE